MPLNSVTCSRCGESVEFDDDGETAACMPDGVITPSGEWVCSDCMVDENGEVLPEFR